MNLGGHNIWAASSLVLELPGYSCLKGSRFVVEWEQAELKQPQLWKANYGSDPSETFIQGLGRDGNSRLRGWLAQLSGDQPFQEDDELT